MHAWLVNAWQPAGRVAPAEHHTAVRTQGAQPGGGDLSAVGTPNQVDPAVHSARDIQGTHRQRELLDPLTEPAGDELAGRPEHRRPAGPHLHRPHRRALVEVPDLWADLAGVELGAVEDGHLGQQPGVRDSAVDGAAVTRGLIEEPPVADG